MVRVAAYFSIFLFCFCCFGYELRTGTALSGDESRTTVLFLLSQRLLCVTVYKYTVGNGTDFH